MATDRSEPMPCWQVRRKLAAWTMEAKPPRAERDEAEKAVAEAIEHGIPVPGRPGFVYSAFAVFRPVKEITVWSNVVEIFRRGVRVCSLSRQPEQKWTDHVHRYARRQDGHCRDHGHLGDEAADAAEPAPINHAIRIQNRGRPVRGDGKGGGDSPGNHAGRFLFATRRRQM